MAKTTIQVDQETKDQLTTFGHMGETYDTLILRLLAELIELRGNETELIRLREGKG